MQGGGGEKVRGNLLSAGGRTAAGSASRRIDSLLCFFAIYRLPLCTALYDYADISRAVNC